jgi:hypothetical protein
MFYFIIIYLFFPETKRLSAEDASAVFDLPYRLGGKQFVHPEPSETDEENRVQTDFIQRQGKEGKITEEEYIDDVKR